MGCNCGCGSSEKCKSINGIGYTIAIASADAADGTGFTYPAANDDAYIGFAPVLANNFTPSLANSNWIWIPIPQAPVNYLPKTYVVSSNTPFTPPADTSTFHTYLQVTGLPAGTYVAKFSCTATNNDNGGTLNLVGAVKMFSNGTPSTDVNSERDVNINSAIDDYITIPMAMDSVKIVVGAAGVISVGARLNNIIGQAFTIAFGTLTVTQVNP